MRRLGKRVVLVDRLADGQPVGAAAERDGKLYLTKSLLYVFEEGEITACLCHELAHLSLGHIDRIRQLVAEYELVGMTRVVAGDPDRLVRAEIKAKMVSALHQHEYEADEVGSLMAIQRFGVLAEECVSVYRKLVSFADGETGYAQFLPTVTHPPLRDRIDRLSTILLKWGYLK